MGYKLNSGKGVPVPTGPAGFSDSFRIAIKAVDTNATPTDAYKLDAAIKFSEINATPTELLTLSLPASNFREFNTAPIDQVRYTLIVFLTGSTGGTNPGNANGEPNGTVATLQTAPAGATSITMTSALGTGVPNISFTNAVLYINFKSVNTLVTSSGTITIRSTSALFSDYIVVNNNTLNNTIDALTIPSGTDLISIGIDTLAKLKSMQLIFKTTDAAAGITPHVMTVDCAYIYVLNATFI